MFSIYEYIHDRYVYIGTKDRRKDFEAVREKDEADRRVIARQSMRLEKLYNGTVELRNLISDFQVNAGRDVADYTFERDYFYKVYIAMQKRLQTGMCFFFVGIRFENFRV